MRSHDPVLLCRTAHSRLRLALGELRVSVGSFTHLARLDEEGRRQSNIKVLNTNLEVGDDCAEQS